MPMRIQELKKYEEYEEEEIAIFKWLEARREDAFTYKEIYKELKGLIPFVPKEDGSYWTLENASSLVLNALSQNHFHEKLKQMVSSGKIKMKIAQGEEYYYVESRI